MLEAQEAQSSCAYLRAKTEVLVNHEEHRYRMKPKNIYKTKSIVNYHWSPKKKRQMQRKIQKCTEPIENQTLEEVWETIRERKEAKMDMSDVLGGLNLSRSYQNIVEDHKSQSPEKKSKVVREHVVVTNVDEGKHQAPRASPPAEVRASPPRASPPRDSNVSRLSSEALEKKDWSFVADNDILQRELELGKELINKAVDKVSAEGLKTIAASNLDQDEVDFLQIHMKLSDLAKGESHTWTWEQIKDVFQNNPDSHINDLKEFADKAEHLTGESTGELKDSFIQIQNTKDLPDYLLPIREFDCEAFCLIDIQEELKASLSPDKRRNLQAMASPQSNIVSPIPNRRDNDLGGASVMKYVNVSQDQSQTNVDQTRLSRSPPKPKRQQNWEDNVPVEHDELNRSISPSRDIVQRINRQQKSNQKKKTKKTQANKVRSPTKRLEQMKNAHVKNATKVLKRGDGYDKMMYTVSPTEGYLVKKEYHPGMSSGDMTQVEQDITDRIDSFVKDNKQYLGRGDDPRRQVLETHEEYKELHGSPTKVVVTTTTYTRPAGDSNASYVLKDMEQEASRICEKLTSGQDESASESINRTYENIRR